MKPRSTGQITQHGPSHVDSVARCVEQAAHHFLDYERAADDSQGTGVPGQGRTQETLHGLHRCIRRGYNRGMRVFRQIRALVAAGDYVVTKHAADRLRQRRIMVWQAVAGLDDGELLLERPRDKPFPVIEVRERLPDGTEFKAVWSLVKDVPLARLVTVHFFD